MNKIAIVGGGPSGIFCALNIISEFKKVAFKDFSIDIFDKGQVLRTLLVTGNGRCNITNAISDTKEFSSNYPRGEKFLYSIFSRYFTFETLDFFKSLGVSTYVQEDNRIFPVSNSAKDVKDKMLFNLLKSKKVKFLNKKINSALDLKAYDKIIVSAGSRGTTSLIKSFNHNCVEFKKALCGLKVENNFSKPFPKGVSVKALDGDFIFTDFGISGPLAFKISSINAYKDFPYEIEIKLFNSDELFELINLNPKKSIGNLVSRFIPKSLAKVIVKNYDKNSCEISKNEIESYSILKLKIVDTAPVGEIVNAGGVDLKEIDKNCKSKKFENLWFCGEILNIDGFCGGFNLQNCWSTGFIVAKDVVSSIIE